MHEKPLALLIPGLDGTGRLYYRHIESLSERFRVVPCEFPQDSSFDVHDLVDDLVRDTEGEKPGSIVVVGDSFGGTVAMLFVLACPARVHSLALINAFPYYRQRIRIFLACRLAPFLQSPCVKSLKDFIVDRELISEGILEEDRIHYREIVRLVGLAGYRRRLELVREVNLLEQLNRIHVPTFLFAAGRDRIVPSVVEGRLMASRIPNSRLYEFPQAGHALLLTPGFRLADYL